MNRENNNGGKFKLAIAVMLVLLGILGYLYYKEKQDKAKVTGNFERIIEKKVTDSLETKSKLDSISNVLDLKIRETEKLGGRVKELVAIREQLERDKREFRNVKLKEYDEKIKSYELILVEKDKELTLLREENSRLTTNNRELNTQNQTLQTDISSTKQAFTDSIRVYSTQKQNLIEKVSIGAALRAVQVKVTGYNENGKEKEKAKKVEYIKIVFNLLENPLTEKERKQIYIRLLNVDGSIISNNSTGSGTFTYNGKEQVYTSKTSAIYSNNNQLVELTYKKSSPFQSGDYTVELYSEGFKIGQGKFYLK